MECLYTQTLNKKRKPLHRVAPKGPHIHRGAAGGPPKPPTSTGGRGRGPSPQKSPTSTGGRRGDPQKPPTSTGGRRGGPSFLDSGGLPGPRQNHTILPGGAAGPLLIYAFSVSVAVWAEDCDQIYLIPKAFITWHPIR